MKETEIAEVLEDGTIHLFDMDVCNQVADETIDMLLNKENQMLKYDFTATVFSLFTRAVHVLTSSGWSTEELINEVIDHSEAEDADDFDCEHDDGQD
jgi:hypothetical protein